MRIIGGKLKGRKFYPPKKLPVRPTTDIAKEALFNILDNDYELSSVRVLDLFSGTGNISLEFLSRGAFEVIGVDKNFGCVSYQKSLKSDLNLENFFPYKNTALKGITKVKGKFDIIFADPPYAMDDIPGFVQAVLCADLLSEGGVFILEHGREVDESSIGCEETRKYGRVCFSFFRN